MFTVNKTKDKKQVKKRFNKRRLCWNLKQENQTGPVVKQLYRLFYWATIEEEQVQSRKSYATMIYPQGIHTLWSQLCCSLDKSLPKQKHYPLTINFSSLEVFFKFVQRHGNNVSLTKSLAFLIRDCIGVDGMYLGIVNIIISFSFLIRRIRRIKTRRNLRLNHWSCRGVSINIIERVYGGANVPFSSKAGHRLSLVSYLRCASQTYE